MVPDTDVGAALAGRGRAALRNPHAGVSALGPRGLGSEDAVREIEARDPAVLCVALPDMDRVAFLAALAARPAFRALLVAIPFDAAPVAPVTPPALRELWWPVLWHERRERTAARSSTRGSGAAGAAR